MGIILAGVVLAVLMPAIDRAVDDDLGLKWAPDSLRSSLSALASGMIAFTGFVFAGVIVAISFGSTAFSTRLVKIFQRDLTTKTCLGVFIATFVYALVLLNQIEYDGRGRIPTYSTVVALVLLILSIVAVFMLFSRLAGMMRAAGLARAIGREGLRAVATLPASGPSVAQPDAGIAAGATQVVRHEGQRATLVALDRDALVEWAASNDAVITMETVIGGSLAPGVPIMSVMGADRPPATERLLKFVVLDDERSIEQDPAYAVRLLVDIAIKALSPAINDPTTAVQALDHIEDLLVALQPRPLGTLQITDGSGASRLVVPGLDWHQYLQLATTEIRHFGADSIQVDRRLLAMLDRLATQATGSATLLPILKQRELVQELATLSFRSPDDQREAQVADALGLGAARTPPMPSGAPE
ncbi:MAG: DUF2254 domain-containing protein [Nocardioidaceae bacterium]